MLNNKFIVNSTLSLITSTIVLIVIFSISIVVYEKHHLVTYYTLIMILSMIPNLILSPFVGAIIDKYNNKERFIWVGIVGASFTVLTIYLLINFKVKLFNPLILINIFFGAFFLVMFRPALSAIASQEICMKDMGKASSFIQVVNTVPSYLCPIISTFLLTLYSFTKIINITFIIQMIFMILTLGFILKQKSTNLSNIRIKQSNVAIDSHFIKDLTETYLYVKKHAYSSLLLLLLFVVFIFSCFEVTAIPALLEIYGKSELSLVLIIAGTGMILGNALFMFVKVPKNPILSILLLTIIVSILLFSAAFYKSTLFIKSFAFLFFLGFGIIFCLINTIVQSVFDKEIIGRVQALINTIYALGFITASIICGPIIDIIIPSFINKFNLFNIYSSSKIDSINLFWILISLFTISTNFLFLQINSLKILQSVYKKRSS